MMMHCFQAKAKQLERQWFVIDAEDAVVGRLAAQIASILMGKHRPTYTPHIDTGDFVIVVNAEKVAFTGKKWEQVAYTRYSGYPGGQRTEVAWKLKERFPDRILFEAVRRMLPKSKLGRQMISKLKLYIGADHPHQAQQPIPLEPKSGRPPASGAIYVPPPKPTFEDKFEPSSTSMDQQGSVDAFTDDTTADALTNDTIASIPDSSATEAPEVASPELSAPESSVNQASVDTAAADPQDASPENEEPESGSTDVATSSPTDSIESGSTPGSTDPGSAEEETKKTEDA